MAKDTSKDPFDRELSSEKKPEPVPIRHTSGRSPRQGENSDVAGKEQEEKAEDERAGIKKRIKEDTRPAPSEGRH